MMGKTANEYYFEATKHRYQGKPLSSKIRYYIESNVQNEVDRQRQLFSDSVINDLDRYLRKNPIIIK